MGIRIEEFHKLYGENAMVIMSATTDILRAYLKLVDRLDERKEILDAYRKEAMSGSYSELIKTSRRYLDEVCGIPTEPYPEPCICSECEKEFIGADEYLCQRCR